MKTWNVEHRELVAEMRRLNDSDGGDMVLVLGDGGQYHFQYMSRGSWLEGNPPCFELPHLRGDLGQANRAAKVLRRYLAAGDVNIAYVGGEACYARVDPETGAVL